MKGPSLPCLIDYRLSDCEPLTLLLTFDCRRDDERPSVRELHGRDERPRGPQLHDRLRQVLLLRGKAKVRSSNLSIFGDIQGDSSGW